MPMATDTVLLRWVLRSMSFFKKSVCHLSQNCLKGIELTKNKKKKTTFVTLNDPFFPMGKTRSVDARNQTLDPQIQSLTLYLLS